MSPDRHTGDGNMKMNAPEGTTSAAVDSVDYSVDEQGQIEVENGEHVAVLRLHGFTSELGEITHSDPVDEIGECPDFSKFVNNQALVDWLAAHGATASVDADRAVLEDACRAHFEHVAAGSARRVEPDAVEPEPEPEVDSEVDPDAEVDSEVDQDAEVTE
jgi:hypothetical protein